MDLRTIGVVVDSAGAVVETKVTTVALGVASISLFTFLLGGEGEASTAPSISANSSSCFGLTTLVTSVQKTKLFSKSLR